MTNDDDDNETTLYRVKQEWCRTRFQYIKASSRQEALRIASDEVGEEIIPGSGVLREWTDGGSMIVTDVEEVKR